MCICWAFHWLWSIFGTMSTFESMAHIRHRSLGINATIVCLLSSHEQKVECCMIIDLRFHLELTIRLNFVFVVGRLVAKNYSLILQASENSWSFVKLIFRLKVLTSTYMYKNFTIARYRKLAKSSKRSIGIRENHRRLKGFVNESVYLCFYQRTFGTECCTRS